MALRARRMYDLKFAPQKTAHIPISRSDGASFSDMILNLAINFEQNPKIAIWRDLRPRSRKTHRRRTGKILTARADFLAAGRRPRAARKRARTIRSLAAEKEF